MKNNNRTIEQSNNRKKPLVSVIMPVYNAGEFLVEAVESIRAQGYKNWELLAIDDKSTDNSLAILRKLAKKDKRIRVLVNKTNRGIGFSLNKALKQVQGGYIARMDADDIALPDRLEKQLKFLQKNPDIIACGGQAQMIDTKGRVFGKKQFPTDSKVLYDLIMRLVPIQHPMLMVRKEIYKSYRYDETVSTAEDVDLLFYLLSKGKISNLKDTIYQYRKSDTNNGYHNTKKTFYITFKTRLRAIVKYKYKPSISGLLYSIGQLVLISILPAKWVVGLYEFLRFQNLKKKRLDFNQIKTIARNMPILSKYPAQAR